MEYAMKVITQDKVALTCPSLLDAINGSYYTIPFTEKFNIGRSSSCFVVIEGSFVSRNHCTIKYENNQFIIFDNYSCSGTYINWNKIPSGESNFAVLNHGDLISFGTENYMKIILKFILPSNPHKRPRFDNNYTIPDVLSLNEKYKTCIKKLHSEILDLKVEQLIFNNNVKTQVTEFQKNLHDFMKTISNYLNRLNVLIPKQKESSIESFKTKVNTLLEDHFQCPICNDVMINASITHCNHAFCQRCISQWLTKSKNCPVCRTPLQTTIYCQSIDNYISDLCELLGGSAKEQRDIQFSELTGNKGRKKRRCTRKSQPRVSRSLHINLRSRTETIDLVDLTNSPI